MELNIWYKFFQNCQLVLGSDSSLIYDLERSTFYQIPNNFAHILNQLKTQDLKGFIEKNDLNETDFCNFINQFVTEEIGFLTSTPEQFPNLNLNWDSPHKICNAIIEVSHKSKFSIDSIINQLNKLGCKALQLRFITSITINELNNVLKKINNSTIKCIEVLFPFNKEVKDIELTQLLTTFPIVRSIYIYNSSNDYTKNNTDKFLDKKITYSSTTKEKLNEENISVDTFIYNIPTFCEANNFNIGLNRKVAICANGEIKNFLNHSEVFGNINKDELQEIINLDSFKEKWFVTNDDIEKCKDCKYRYACLSNSDISKKNNKFYKSMDCTYNPYEDKWEN